MRTLVVDASVTVKWIFPESINESHLSQALNILHSIRKGSIAIAQPPHWLAETIAVVARLEPKIAVKSASLLYAMELPIVEGIEIYKAACHLSERFDHHLFDTLYHATAMCHGNAEFITADEKYYKKAHKQGSIVRLSSFSLFDD